MVDQLLGAFFGAQDDDDDERRRGRARDFADRYQRGAFDQMGDDEVIHNYRAATSRLTPDEYRTAVSEALRKMDPEQRKELRREMRRRSRDHYDAADDSPEEVAKAMQHVDQEEQGGGGLAGLFGLGGSEQGADAKTAADAKGGLQSLLDNPLAKMAMAGVAAYAATKLADPNR